MRNFDLLKTDQLKKGITEKTPERLQAQAEIFADKDAESFSNNQTKLLSYSAELSKIKDLDNLPEDLPEELVDLIRDNKDSYLSFLRKEKKLETTFIEENIKIYQEQFSPSISELKTKMKTGDYKNLPEYLGSGSNGSAFKIEAGGEEFAAKFSQRVSQASFEIKPLIRARGVEHAAQLKSYSFEDQVVIMGLLPGVDISNFTPEDDPKYSDKNIVQLIETVRELDSRGIVIDPKPSNFMYDEEKGFSILDFHLKNKGRFMLPDQIMSLGNALATRKYPHIEYGSPDYDKNFEAQSIKRYKIFLPTMIKFLSILKDKYPDILDDWKMKQEELKKDPRISVYELIRREYIPKDPELDVYLKKLDEMGF